MNPGPHAAARPRFRFAAMTAILLVAATTSVVVANLIASRTAIRVDVTSTREHQLAPRTAALLADIAEPYEIVIAAPLRDPAFVDQRALQRIADVLDRFQRSQDHITITTIDTGSTAGLGQFDALLHRLVERDAPRIRQHLDVISAAIDATEATAQWLESMSPRLQAVRDAIPHDSPGASANRTYFDQRATEARVNARTLRDIAQRARETVEAPDDDPEQIIIPDTTQAAEILRRPLADLRTGLAGIADNLRTFVEADGMPAQPRDLVRPLIAEITRHRDRCAIHRDALDRLQRLDLLRIAGALQSESVALVIGPPEVGLTAIEFASLFPTASVIDGTAGGSADLGRNAEELLATALASLAHPVKPIVVLIHAQPRGYFDRQPFFRLMTQRLQLRGMDVATWEAAVTDEPPSLARLNPGGDRPVVYLCFNADTPSSGSEHGQSGPERAQRLGRALKRIVDEGHPLLLSIYPSTLPTFGEPDPTIAFLPDFGLKADSARPLLRERITTEGRLVDAFQVLRAAESEHRIARAVRGLPTRFEWPIGMRILEDGESPGSSSSAPVVTPLYTINDRTTWGESQWLGYLQVPLAQHHRVPNPPAPDSTRDDTSGSWIIAAAAERTLRGLDRPQRLVAVGSNTWFVDWVLGDMSEVDGRIVPANPGNAEFLEAAIYWLAGQDALIAQSPTARAVPLISELSPGALLALKLAAIAGLPALVLAFGAVWRVLRG